jgi:hypothetical protein
LRVIVNNMEHRKFFIWDAGDGERVWKDRGDRIHV